MPKEQQLPEDIVILTEDRGEASQRLEWEEEKVRNRIKAQNSEKIHLNGSAEVFVSVSKVSGDEEDTEYQVNLLVNSTTKRICTVAPSGTILDGNLAPCSLNDLLRLSRILDLFGIPRGEIIS